MKTIALHTEAWECTDKDLSLPEVKIADLAREVALKAYAPYSGFKVGAAVWLANDEFITGNNQENAAYPSGMCAERVALFYANARFPFVPVKAIAVAAFHQGKFCNFVSPCGGCRQVLAEVEKRFKTPVKVLLCGNENIIMLKSAGDLLPLRFDSLD